MNYRNKDEKNVKSEEKTKKYSTFLFPPTWQKSWNVSLLIVEGETCLRFYISILKIFTSSLFVKFSHLKILNVHYFEDFHHTENIQHFKIFAILKIFTIFNIFTILIIFAVLKILNIMKIFTFLKVFHILKIIIFLNIHPFRECSAFWRYFADQYLTFISESRVSWFVMQ